MLKQKAYRILIALTFVLALSPARADEGMWLISLLNELNYGKLEQLGLKLKPDEIFSTQNASLKDAIAAIDKGSCSGSIISPSGLMITNHHCGYGEIQNHSSAEHDYLLNGFWASKLEDELPNPGKSVSFLVDVKDVTAEVNKMAEDQKKSNSERPNMMRIKHTIARSAVKGSHYDAEVQSMFGGNRYYLFIYETFLDVRLVGAPPSNIGNFGDETDNWVWPRHSGDFALFRVYTAPDGKPAEYSPSNVPLKPKKYLKISIDGVNENSFAMVIGYPGSTSRYLTSHGVNEIVNIIDPTRVDFRNCKLGILREEMKSDQIRIKYASKFSQASNYWKYSIGEIESLKRDRVTESKQEQENKFQTWTNESEQRAAEYGSVLKTIAEAYSQKASITSAIQQYSEGVLTGPEIFKLAIKMKQLEIMLDKKDSTKEINNEIIKLKKEYKYLFKDYDSKVDKRLFVSMLQLFVDKVDHKFLPETFTSIAEKYKWNMSKLGDDVYKLSIFSDSLRINTFAEKPSIKALRNDLSFRIAKALFAEVVNLNRLESDFDRKIGDAQKSFIRGLIEMESGKDFYPDANSTMRLTYGKIQGYSPSDGVVYSPFTTMKGIVEKNSSGAKEYKVFDRLVDLYKQKDFGQYGIDGTMPTCFIADLDITGGNSGSPVLNGNGALIGLAFDGNWEAMSGDIVFSPEKQRCICVDIRYVLFIIDKYANCNYLTREIKKAN